MSELANDKDYISLTDILKILWKKRRLIVAIVSGITLLVLGLSLISKRDYKLKSYIDVNGWDISTYRFFKVKFYADENIKSLIKKIIAIKGLSKDDIEYFKNLALPKNRKAFVEEVFIVFSSPTFSEDRLTIEQENKLKLKFVGVEMKYTDPLKLKRIAKVVNENIISIAKLAFIRKNVDLKLGDAYRNINDYKEELVNVDNELKRMRELLASYKILDKKYKNVDIDYAKKLGIVINNAAEESKQIEKIDISILPLKYQMQSLEVKIKNKENEAEYIRRLIKLYTYYFNVFSKVMESENFTKDYIEQVLNQYITQDVKEYFKEVNDTIYDYFTRIDEYTDVYYYIVNKGEIPQPMPRGTVLKTMVAFFLSLFVAIVWAFVLDFWQKHKWEIEANNNASPK